MSEEYVAFTVYGRAQQAGSKRMVPSGRPGGRYHVTDDNPRARDWQRLVFHEAVAAMNRRPLLAGPLRLRLRFVVVRPGGHYTSKGELSAVGRRRPYPDMRPDLTKLVRGLEDALTGVVWRDDAQVVQQEASKVYGEPARVEVEVEPATPAHPYDGDPQGRLDRLAGAIGDENAAGIEREQQLGATLRLIERQDRCRCGATYEPLARACASCGRATFSGYAIPPRAARVPLEPDGESLQIAGSA